MISAERLVTVPPSRSCTEHRQVRIRGVAHWSRHLALAAPRRQGRMITARAATPHRSHPGRDHTTLLERPYPFLRRWASTRYSAEQYVRYVTSYPLFGLAIVGCVTKGRSVAQEKVSRLVIGVCVFAGSPRAGGSAPGAGGAATSAHPPPAPLPPAALARCQVRPRLVWVCVLTADRYRLLEVLGRSGLGDVWRAEDTSLGREVAVNLLLDRTRYPMRWNDSARRRGPRPTEPSARPPKGLRLRRGPGPLLPLHGAGGQPQPPRRTDRARRPAGRPSSLSGPFGSSVPCQR